MLHRKVIMAIADGSGDRPHPLLQHQTPLEHAHTPNLDRHENSGRNRYGSHDFIWIQA